MQSVTKWVRMLTVLAMSAAAPAVAQSITEPLSFLTPFSVGGWTIQLGTCAYTNNNVIGDCGTESVMATVSGATLSMVFKGTNGPSGNAFLYSAGGGLQSDITDNFSVTAPSGQTIYYATDATAGSTAGNLTFVRTGVSFSTPSEPQIATNLSTTFASEAFTPAVPKLGSVGVDFAAGNGLAASTITTATLTFNAPEPISSSLLVVGLAGIGVVRRKFRRTA